MKKALLFSTAAIGAALFAATAQAAGTNTGVEAGLFAMGTDLTTIYQGAGGNLILIISLIIGVILFAATTRWVALITPVAAGLFLGYGQGIATSLGGVGADIAMVEIAAADADAIPVTPAGEADNG